jgi:Zn-dependent protease
MDLAHIFGLVILMFSVMVHEVSHGFVAEKLGDPTARNAGRLTMNPMSHIDLFGSVLLPLILVFTNSPVLFGWAKPVPYDPRNLKDPRAGSAMIAAAGPLSNFFLAFIFGLAVRFSFVYGMPPDAILPSLFAGIVFANVSLGVFNLVPIPPLDGSKILMAVLPPGEKTYRFLMALERNGMLLIFLFIFFGYSVLNPVIRGLFAIFTGLPLG